MRALVATAPGRLTLATDLPGPNIEAGQVLVRTRVSAVSAGTELRMLYEGRAEHGPDPEWPVIGAFGYMAAGDVLAVAPDVTDVRVGDRVACGRTWGGHREFIETAAASVQHLPDDVSYLEGACAYWAVPPMCGILAARPELYTDAAVVGLGPLGLAAVQMLVPFMRRVIAIDPLEGRRAVAAGYGADTYPPDAVAAVGATTSERPAVVLQAAGSQAALELCLQLCQDRGTVVNVGTLPNLSGVDLFWPMQNSGVHLVPIHRPGAVADDADDGALGSMLRARYLPSVIDMVRRRRLDIGGLCTSCVPIESGPDALRMLHTRPDRFLGLAFAWDPSSAAGTDVFDSTLSEERS